MKTFLALTLISSLVTANAFARRGDDNNNNNSIGSGSSDNDEALLPDGTVSPAWFLHESLEHAARLQGPKVSPATLSGYTARIVTAAETSVVTFSYADGSEVLYTCRVYDDSSHSGTVLKKDVFCLDLPAS